MKRLIFLVCLIFAGGALMAQNLPSQTTVAADMRRVADWQIRHQPTVRWTPGAWHNGALYCGMCDWGELAERTEKDASYTYWLLGIAQGARWTPESRRGLISHADDFCAPQTWLRLSERFGNASTLKPIRQRLDDVIASLKNAPEKLEPGRAPHSRWVWCDTLYMAPALYAKMTAVTGDPKYLAFMHREYQAATAYLYDREEHLYYRDARFFPKGKKHLEANGKKIFWGRGNGWVFGGLANVLRCLPADASVRPYYEQLFREMAARLIQVQSPDGCWHASLLNPEAYPAPETSASGFVVYGLAWGINEGLLDRAVYLPAVLRGWKALVNAVHPDGKLGFVQPVGAAPGAVTRDMTEVYGVGAFLQAGVQVWRLAGADEALRADK